MCSILQRQTTTSLEVWTLRPLQYRDFWLDVIVWTSIVPAGVATLTFLLYSLTLNLIWPLVQTHKVEPLVTPGVFSFFLFQPRLFSILGTIASLIAFFVSFALMRRVSWSRVAHIVLLWGANFAALGLLILIWFFLFPIKAPRAEIPVALSNQGVKIFLSFLVVGMMGFWSWGIWLLQRPEAKEVFQTVPRLEDRVTDREVT